jgi:hypothetical protein
MKLLEKISFDRSFKKLEIDNFRLPTISVIETEKYLVRFFNSLNIKYCFTGFSGLKHYFEYHISYPLIHIYIPNTVTLNKIERGEGAIPVIALKPDRNEIFNEAKKFQNIYVCDKTQVAIDLFSSGIGRDAAIKLLEVDDNGNTANPS